MAEVKWIKITTDMFDNRKIKYLRKLPDGDCIVLIWVMLLTMAGRCNAGGKIYLTEDIPYTPKMLADELDFPENTVLLALQALERMNMIISEEDGFSVVGWEEYQNIEGMDRIREQNRLRQQKRREKTKQGLIGSANTCEYCGNEGATIDHLIPKAKGGLDSPENTVCSCLSCNMKKTNRDLDVFLNEMMATSSDFELDRILSNNKIMRFVIFDDLTSKFVSRDVTLRVTECHAIEEEEETEKEFHSFTRSAVGGQDEEDFLSPIQPRSAEEMEQEEAKERTRMKYMSGTLGQGYLFLSQEQFESLLDELSYDEFHKYVNIVVECEKNGKKFRKKSHYQAILDMARKDRRT